MRATSIDLALLLYDLNETPRIVKNSNGMREPRVCGTWKNELRESKLLDTSESLKFWSIYQLKRYLVCLILSNEIRPCTESIRRTTFFRGGCTLTLRRIHHPSSQSGT